MASKRDRASFGLGDQPAANAAAPQLLMHPEQIDEQPAGVEVPDQPGADRTRIVAHE